MRTRALGPDAPSSFGELLRRHRLAVTLSQEALAERTGLSARAVADLERGVRRFPYPETVKRLADGLGLTLRERASFIDASGRSRVADEPPLSAARSTLPMPPTSFVGREQDLAEARNLLSSNRMLTLTGPGGVGKTRLAVALAVAARAEYEDGVWFVDLAPLADDSLVIVSAATALGIRERPGRALTEVVCETLADRCALLVLDNCEHVLMAAAAFAEQLLRHCPAVRILVTSREPLRIGGETRWRVPALSIPESESGVTAQNLVTFGATRLFVERAQTVSPGFELDASQAAAITHICQRLEGVPLAIELAAARVAMFSVEQIASRIDRSFQLLSSGARTAPPRQQTLRATIDWSYGLLPAPDRVLLDRLATFAGGWTFEAAEAVAGGDGIPGEDVLGLLGGLVDRSLVVAASGADGAIRYRLLEVLRQYGQERLAELGQIESTRARHAAYFLDVAEAAEPRVLGPDRKLWLDRLEAELDNFRAARRWFVGAHATEPAMRLAAALYRLWMYRGYAEEGAASLAEALALDGGSLAARAKALFCSGGLGVTIIQTDYATAQRQLQESLSRYREIGDVSGAAWALMGVGAAAAMGADFQVAAEVLDEARQTSLASGQIAALALSLAWSAEVSYQQGDFATARTFAEGAVRSSESVGFAIPACMALTALGNLHWREGALDAAERVLQAAWVKAEELDEAYPIVRTAISLALLAAGRGQLDRARALLARSVELAQQAGNRHHVAQAFEGLAAFAALTGEPQTAVQLAGAASAARMTIGAPLRGTERDLLQRHLQAAYQRLDPRTAASAHSEGRAWPIAHATAFALQFASAASAPASSQTAPTQDGTWLRSAGLTPREYEVARLVARGLRNREIADELVINEKTAKNHVQRVLEKLGVNSRSRVIALAPEFGQALDRTTAVPGS